MAQCNSASTSLKYHAADDIQDLVRAASYGRDTRGLDRMESQCHSCHRLSISVSMHAAVYDRLFGLHPHHRAHEMSTPLAGPRLEPNSGKTAAQANQQKNKGLTILDSDCGNDVLDDTRTSMNFTRPPRDP